MKIDRSSGVLLHITSLPGRYGIGTLGKEAKDFADTLKRCGHTYWQILPIGPVSPALAFSPYSSPSTFAGNYLFISMEKIIDEEWYNQKNGLPELADDKDVNFQNVASTKTEFLEKAAIDFFSNSPVDELNCFNGFCDDSEYWLNDFALFSALSEHYNTNNWLNWDKPVSTREPEAIEIWNERLKERVGFHKFVQYIFFKQWFDFKNYCNSINIEIIGDIPIYIMLESADAWAHREIFQLDEESGRPDRISGVPPDYFSETGQRWGNPLYRWYDDDKNLFDPTINWWEKRIRHLNKITDIIRIDHFRGFEAYWSIPAHEKTAINGKWVKGPGIDFFHRLKGRLKDYNLIAEDLGVITPGVEKLRDGLGLPGMKILQFAFDYNNKNYYLPHNITDRNCILYTGTHDNNTTNGWFYGEEVDEKKKKYIMDYLGTEKFSDFHWQLIRAAYRSVANLVIIPAQDITGFGAGYRMNKPGTIDGNWKWKLKKNDITVEHINIMKSMGIMYNRITENNKD